MTTEASRKAKKNYRSKCKRILIDFYPSEADLIAHIANQPQKQTYIKNLIRADLAAESSELGQGQE